MSKEDNPGSNLVIYAALAANLVIAIAKFVAAAITGSSSMLTDGVQTFAPNAASAR